MESELEPVSNRESKILAIRTRSNQCFRKITLGTARRMSLHKTGALGFIFFNSYLGKVNIIKLFGLTYNLAK